ncbi:MAG: phosphoglycerate kinase [SAR86 cluster bacterium]|uniref:Phosphoglycerate kinase n=1 Tax=SAR86 cluster bacterium TaxID=2030880 RepID=A0A2A4MTS2_9GAMM|nr:MAG: phosphoglycerate kinase [SAR86 cluster bacterium]
MTILNLAQIDIQSKRVLIRADLNVPIKAGKIVNHTRIKATLPTIQLAMSSGAQVIVMSHLGRPVEGKPIDEQASMSLQPVADSLAELLNCKVNLITDYLAGQKIETKVGELSLLENVRINPGEKANDDDLAKAYAALCDVFVMDAFGTAHRAQASTHGVAKFAAISCAGPLLSKELSSLDRSLKNPRRPMLAIVGGAKVSSKLKVIEALADKVDQLIVGGGIANTFMAAAGINIGKSLYEEDLVDCAKQIMKKTQIPLPVDVMVAKEFSEQAQAQLKSVDEIADDDMILDIGPLTAKNFAAIIAKMETIIWNGPVGVFEFKQFSAGTEAIAKAIGENTGFSIAGGGETITAIDNFGVTDKISYISTGGGAFLEFVQGKVLPAVQILESK